MDSSARPGRERVDRFEPAGTSRNQHNYRFGPDQLEIEFGQMADAFADSFRKGDCRHEFPAVRGALDSLRRRADQIRRERILATESLDAPIQLLEVISRCQRIGETLEECPSLIKSLSIHRYWGDYAL
jgi:hypothetical protein